MTLDQLKLMTYIINACPNSANLMFYDIETDNMPSKDSAGICIIFENQDDGSELEINCIPESKTYYLIYTDATEMFNAKSDGIIYYPETFVFSYGQEQELIDELHTYMEKFTDRYDNVNSNYSTISTFVH